VFVLGSPVMTVQLLASLPRDVQRQVVQQRFFVSALQLALTSHDHPTILERARELQDIAAVGRIAVKQARSMSGDDWQEIAKIALTQSLAASAGAALLFDAAKAIGGGEHDRLVFFATTRRTFGLVAAPIESSTVVVDRAAAPAQPV
jgi:hypothetical protein